MTLSGIFVYPIKSCRGIARGRHEVGPSGFDLDRRWMLVDDAGTFLSQRTLPAMATIGVALDGAGLLVTAPERSPLRIPRTVPSPSSASVRIWADAVGAVAYPAEFGAWFSELLGVPCRLVSMPDPSPRPVNLRYGAPGDRVGFADAYPFHLLSEASLEDLNGRLARPVPMDRFRPNLVVRGTAPFAEDRWRRIRIGAMTFRVVKPCVRCTVPGIDQRTGVREKEPLAALAAYRTTGNDVRFGQNVIADGTGLLEVGMPVEVIEGTD